MGVGGVAGVGVGDGVLVFGAGGWGYGWVWGLVLGCGGEVGVVVWVGVWG